METEILIVHLNGEKVIENCLDSIYKDDNNSNVRILFNNTSDRSRELVIKKFPKAKIHESRELIGFAKACNFLVKESNAEHVILLNNDVEVGKNWSKELLKTLKNNEKCVAVQGKIMSYNERNKFEYAGAAGGFIDKFGYPFCRGRIFGYLEEDNGQYDQEKRIFWGCGVCLLVERKYFLKNGMFDEKLFMYSEELDFCWRVNIYGKEIWYSPKAKIYHIGNFSTGAYTADINNVRKDYWIIRNHLIVLLKNFSNETLLKIFPTRILLEIISAIRFAPIRTISFLRSFLSIGFYHIFHIINARKKISQNRIVNDNSLSKLIYQRSIVFEHFISKKNKFTELK